MRLKMFCEREKVKSVSRTGPMRVRNLVLSFRKFDRNEFFVANCARFGFAFDNHDGKVGDFGGAIKLGAKLAVVEVDIDVFALGAELIGKLKAKSILVGCKWEDYVINGLLLLDFWK